MKNVNNTIREPLKRRSLRRRAESILAKKGNGSPLIPRDTAELVHELEVHKIELEAQQEDLIGTQQELRQTNEDLRYARDRYRDLYDFAPVAYFTIDFSTYRILEANITAADLLKTEKNTIFRSKFVKFITPEFTDAFHLCLRKLLAEPGKATFEIQMRRSDTSVFWALLDVVGGPDGKMRVAVMDITNRKKAEQDLKQRTTDLEAANKELESFSSAVAHDLRAPLRSMDGYSEALLEDYADKLDDQGKEWLRNIRHSSQLMAVLIDDILTLSHVVRSELKFQNMNLSRAAVAVAASLRHRAPERAIEFVIYPGIEVYGDAHLLRLALKNLLENAFKFTDGCKAPRIEFGKTQKDGKPVYFVRDNGVGFDMKYVDKLFRPFQRLHNENQFAGTGIGLVTVQRIIKRHGGSVRAEGEVGKGATFYFTLGEQDSTR